MENNWQTKTISEVFRLLQSSASGLSQEEAAARLKRYGANALPQGKRDNLAIIFFKQFQSPLIYILIAASLAVFFMGQTADGLIILAVLLFNALVGTVQEGRAQNTLLALKKFTQTKATVLRQNRELIISDAEVAPGDILILQAGEKVPADARIILSHDLAVDESALTGESEPVHKMAEAEQRNLVFKGTYVLSGGGQAVAVATGLKTAIGKIAKEIEAIDADVPFKANIRYLSRLIIIAVSSISVLLFLLGLASGKSAAAMFATVAALAVSIIPEGLPIVMTLVLAGGVWRMSRQNVLVKKLQAVEALGQAQVIAVDKTGTLTKNEMVAQTIYAAEKFFTVDGDGYEPGGRVYLNGRAVNPADYPELAAAGKIALRCASARLVFEEETGRWRVAGDPTEAAMQVLAQKLGLKKQEPERQAALAIDQPFDYKLKYHAALHQLNGRRLISVAGAPETVLNLCALSGEQKRKLEAVFLQLSGQSLRVVALAQGKARAGDAKIGAIGQLTFAGFLGMRDGLRPEAVKAVEKITAAGIRVVMITGDHLNTAQAIARQAGIYRPGDLALTGEEIDRLSDRTLGEKINQVSVFARVTPEHKLRIIQAYKALGQIVAMTGDGVNDAPSLSAADLGVAMGKIGTEVAKEAADIVLLEDDLGNIVLAAEEGRNIYKTIKRVILYLFSTSAGEALTIAGALALGLPLPILPAQIIWLNFVTDGFLDVALAMEPKKKRLLDGNAPRPKKIMVDRLMAWRMLLMALVMAGGALYLFSSFAADLNKAWTISLTTLAVFQWFNAWNCRSTAKSILRMNPLANKFLAGATVIVIALQLIAVYNPVMQKVLHTVPLSLSDWLAIIPLALTIVAAEEIRKIFYRRKLKLYNER